jgi:hypothetical protein
VSISLVPDGKALHPKPTRRPRTQKPKPPPPSAGEKLRTQIDAALPDGAEWSERENALLDLAVRQADDIGSLEAVLEAQGPTVKGSMGQSRLNPVFAELRQSRLALSRILHDLKMPDEGLDGGQAKDTKAQRAARVRWNGANS